MNPTGFITVTRVDRANDSEQIILAVRSIVFMRRIVNNTTHIVIVAPGLWESLEVTETLEEVLQKIRHASG